MLHICQEQEVDAASTFSESAVNIFPSVTVARHILKMPRLMCDARGATFATLFILVTVQASAERHVCLLWKVQR